ncbi:MAG: enoyl-CoA hydratase-related protein, partial [Verrucomicrobiota bacterium]
MITQPISPQTESVHPSHRKPMKSHVLHLEVLENDIAVITFDRPDKAANIFDEATLDELNLAIEAVESLDLKAVVFTSAKPKIFLAGADLDALANASEERLEQLIRKGQDVFQRIAELPFPTLAAIHGACLGGGLELSLACDQRIASDDRSTRIGLPETLLGILPAWGGSTRLPRLIGLPKALNLILAGKTLPSKQAFRLGVVDGLVPKEKLTEVALDRVLKTPRRKNHFLTNNAVSRRLIGGLAKRGVLRKTRGLYPAQKVAAEVVTAGAGGSVEKSLRREETAVLRLARGPEAAQLMRLFRLQERAKKF